jgi:hypothetical protein
MFFWGSAFIEKTYTSIRFSLTDINNASGIFYTPMASIKNILARTSASYFATEQIKGFRRESTRYGYTADF